MNACHAKAKCAVPIPSALLDEVCFGIVEKQLVHACLRSAKNYFDVPWNNVAAPVDNLCSFEALRLS